MTETAPPLILASASPSRAALLTAAGLPIHIEPADLDEAKVKDDGRAAGHSVAQIAARLACEKAKKISAQQPDAWVIGADQMLDCDGDWLDKPADMAGAAETLRRLRGKTHELVTSVSVVRSAQEHWAHTDRARLTMRSYSDAFQQAYLDAVGPAALTSVGAYQLEGRGSQLFERIEGDYFTILGLPLLPLLDFLRQQGVIDT